MDLTPTSSPQPFILHPWSPFCAVPWRSWWEMQKNHWTEQQGSQEYSCWGNQQAQTGAGPVPEAQSPRRTRAPCRAVEFSMDTTYFINAAHIKQIRIKSGLLKASSQLHPILSLFLFAKGDVICMGFASRFLSFTWQYCKCKFLFSVHKEQSSDWATTHTWCQALMKSQPAPIPCDMFRLQSRQGM